jgi:hypothetical protein
LPSRRAVSVIFASTSPGSTLASTRTRESESSVTVVSIERLTLDDDRSRSSAGLAPTRRERIEAWALTGPPGRAWSFARDLVSALPMLARFWVGRIRGRSGDEQG